jgi:hypothetical protein
MRPATTIIKKVVKTLYRKSLESEFASILGFPVLFSPSAPYLWAVVVIFVLICGFAGWLEGGIG